MCKMKNVIAMKLTFKFNRKKIVNKSKSDFKIFPVQRFSKRVAY